MQNPSKQSPPGALHATLEHRSVLDGEEGTRLSALLDRSADPLMMYNNAPAHSDVQCQSWQLRNNADELLSTLALWVYCAPHLQYGFMSSGQLRTPEEMVLLTEAREMTEPGNLRTFYVIGQGRPVSRNLWSVKIAGGGAGR